MNPLTHVITIILHLGLLILGDAVSSSTLVGGALQTGSSTNVCGTHNTKFFMPGHIFPTGNLCGLNLEKAIQDTCDPYDQNEATIWSTASGWVHKDGSKFFPVGLWMAAIRDINDGWGNSSAGGINKPKIDSAASYFDVFHQERRFLQAYMVPETIHYHLSTGAKYAQGRIMDLGVCGLSGDNHFKKLIVDDDQRPFDSGKRSVNFTEMMKWRRNIECAQDRTFYKNYFRDLVVPEIYCKARFLDSPGIKNNDFIWFLSDEPEQQWDKAERTQFPSEAVHHKGWAIHPDLLQLYHDAVKEVQPNALTFVSFGTLRGHVYTYDHLYNTAHSPDSLHHADTALLPLSPPMYLDDLDRAKLEGDPRDYQSYRYAHDGTALYEYDASRDEWDVDGAAVDTSQYYDNLFHVAQGYCATGDVLGLNAYTEFRFYPHWAGRTVDAIKDACGDDKPVWLHFDAGWTQSKDPPNGIHTAKTYMLQVRNQVFTSIAHGATGIWFWGNDDKLDQKIADDEILDAGDVVGGVLITENQADAYWDTLTGLAQELQNLKPVLKGEILSQGVQNIHLHYTVRQPTGGNPHLIVTNTDLVNSQTFVDTLGLFGTRNLASLEVVSTDVQTPSSTWSGTISANTTWSGLVRVVGNITLDTGYTLTVDAGTTLQVEGDYEIKTLGTLQVNGSQGAPVRARFHTANPNSGDWKGFRIEGTTNLNHIEIDHADYGLLIDGFATATLDHVTLRECTTGLMVDNQTPTVSNSRFESNGLGLDAFGANTQVDIDHTLFVDNTNAIHARNNAQVNVTTSTIDNTTIKGVESSIYAGVALDHTAVTGSGSYGLATDLTDTLSLAYSNIYSDTGTHYLFVTDPLGANGNLSTPPHYFNTTLILNEPSLLIDAGDPAAATGSEPGGPARLDIGRHAGTNDASAPIEDALQDGDFELGTAWWENAWSDRNTGTVTVWQRRSDNRPGKTGTHYYTTCDDDNCTTAQAHRGVLRSHRFKLPAEDYLQFKVAGFSANNKVRLVKAADDTDLLTAFTAPGTSGFVDQSWTIPTAEEGTWVYLEAVDKDNGATNAWLAVDDFRFTNTPLPKRVVKEALPTTYHLAPNYPNPFNPETTIAYALPEDTPVRLEIYNLLGQQVRVLVDQTQRAGHYRLIWDGRNQAGAPLASGVYLYRLIAGDYQQTHKLTLLK